MSIDICKAIFRKLAADGTVFTTNTFRTLRATYYRTALDLLEAYANDAADERAEPRPPRARSRRSSCLPRTSCAAGKVFLDNPHETPFIPNWNRVNAADPDDPRRPAGGGGGGRGGVRGGLRPAGTGRDGGERDCSIALQAGSKPLRRGARARLRRRVQWKLAIQRHW